MFFLLSSHCSSLALSLSLAFGIKDYVSASFSPLPENFSMPSLSWAGSDHLNRRSMMLTAPHSTYRYTVEKLKRVEVGEGGGDGAAAASEYENVVLWMFSLHQNHQSKEENIWFRLSFRRCFYLFYTETLIRVRERIVGLYNILYTCSPNSIFATLLTPLNLVFI